MKGLIDFWGFRVLSCYNKNLAFGFQVLLITCAWTKELNSFKEVHVTYAANTYG
jgi:hypothetical protein